MIGVISLMLLVMWILFIFSSTINDEYLIFISCCGFIILNIYIIVNGLEGINNWVTQAFAVIHIGIGSLGLLEPLLNIDGDDDYEKNNNDE